MRFKDGHSCTLECVYTKLKGPPNPGIFSRIIWVIRRFTTVSYVHPYTKYFYRSQEKLTVELKRHILSSLWFSIHPYSSFNYVWQLFISVVYVFTSGVELLETTMITYDDKYEYFVPARIVSIVLNVLCLLNIMVNFVLGYAHWEDVQEVFFSSGFHKIAKQTVILQKGCIARRYLKTYFIVDCIAIVKISQIYLDQYLDRRKCTYYLFFIYMFRHIRFVTVFENIRICVSDHSYDDFLYRLSIRLFIYFYLQLVMCNVHIIFPSMMQYFSGRKKSGIIEEIQAAYKKIGLPARVYIIYMYMKYLTNYSLAGMFAEKMVDPGTLFFFTICFVVNIIMKGIFMTYLLQFLASFYKSHLKYGSFSEEVKRFQEAKKVNSETAEHMHKYLATVLKWELFDVKIINDTLSPRLRYDIFEQSSMNLVKTCHLFNNLPQEVISRLAMKLTLQTYNKGAPVVKIGEAATCMYFIATGTVAVYGKAGQEICHLSDGAYFGEIGLVPELSKYRVASVICVEYCEFYRLGIRDFQLVIKPGTSLYKRIITLAKKRLKERRVTEMPHQISGVDLRRVFYQR